MMRSDEPFQLYITKCKELELLHMYTSSALIISCQGVISGITAGGYEGIGLQTTGIVGLALSASLLVLGRMRDYFSFNVLKVEHSHLADEFNNLMCKLHKMSINDLESMESLDSQLDRLTNLENKSNQIHLRRSLGCFV